MSKVALDTIQEICEGYSVEDADYMDAKLQFRQRIGRNPTADEKKEITLCIKKIAFTRTDELIDHLCFQHTDYMGVKTEFRKIKGRDMSATEKSNVQSKLRAIEWARLVQEKEEREAKGEVAEDIDPVSLTSGELASVRKATMNLRAEIDRAIAQSVVAARDAAAAEHDSGNETEDTDEGDPDSDDDFEFGEGEAPPSPADDGQLPQAEDPMEETRRLLAEALLEPAADDEQTQEREFDVEAHREKQRAAREAEERRLAAEQTKQLEEEEKIRQAEREAEIAAAEELVRQQEAARQAEIEQQRKEEAAKQARILAAREEAARQADLERERQAAEQRRLAEAEATRIAAIEDEQKRAAAEKAEEQRVAKEAAAAAQAQKEAAEERARLAREQDAAYMAKVKAEADEELRDAERKAAEDKAKAKLAEAEALKAAAEKRKAEAAAKLAAAATSEQADSENADSSETNQKLMSRPKIKAHRVKKSVLVIQMAQKIKQATMYTPPKRDLRRHGKSDKIRLLARCFMSKNETESDILRRMRAPRIRDKATRKKAYDKLDGKLSVDQGNFVQDALKNIIVQAVVAIPDEAESQQAMVSSAVTKTKNVVVERNSVTEETLRNLAMPQVQRTVEPISRKRSGKIDVKGVVADTTSASKTAAQLAHLPKLHQLQRQEALARKDRLNKVAKGLGDFCLETEKLAAAAMVSAGYLGNTANMEPIGSVAIAAFMGKKHRNGAWGKRCFVVKADTRELHYFKTVGKGAKRSICDWIGCVQLDSIKLMKKKGRVLQIVFDESYAKQHDRLTLTLRAKTEEIVEEWISILQATMQAGSAVNQLASKLQSQTSAIASSISDRMAASVNTYANNMMAKGHRFANVDELISHQFARALKILKSIMDTTQGKSVLELEAIRLKGDTDIGQDDMQFAYDNLLDMLERAVVLHCHNWWVAHMGPMDSAESESDDDEPAPPPPPRGPRSPKADK